jgi:3-oxoacyl-[acyl-carrier-protein] synthase III
LSSRRLKTNNMIYNNVNIESFGYAIPPVCMSSEDIEKRIEPVYERLKLPLGRLELMTGIKKRHFWKEGTMPSDGAILAGKKALSNSSISSSKIGCLVMCSVCRDFLEPATATVVHNSLGLPEDAMVFDISNACLGIMTGMITVANMIELGQIEAGMLVAGENSGPLVESTIKTILNDSGLTRQSIKPYFASLTIGSGAVAFILSKKELSDKSHRLIAGTSLAATQYNDLCRGNEDKGMFDGADTIMNTDSELLMKYGVETAAKTWNNFKKETGWENSTPDCICTHQVGSAHRKLLFETLGLDTEKDYPTLSEFGNTGSVSCPMTFAMAVEEENISDGDKVALLGIGSGINCTMLGVEW